MNSSATFLFYSALDKIPDDNDQACFHLSPETFSIDAFIYITSTV